jgi:hypothetical protein
MYLYHLEQSTMVMMVMMLFFWTDCSADHLTVCDVMRAGL